MLLNCSENEKLFAKSVPVSIKNACSKRTTHLFFTIEWQDTSDGGYSRKALVLSLTDNNDPFFLYNLYLSEEDFQLLKANQELLINFSSFPQHIIDYIEKCLREENNPQPRFLLIFTVNESFGSVTSHSQLDIIETNQFKNLTHLSLKFIAATESTVKQYLITCFRNLKEERRQLQNKLASLEEDSKDKLSAYQRTLSSKVQEFESERERINTELSLKASKYAIELQTERDQLLQRQREDEERYKKEYKEREHKLYKEIQQLEDNVSSLDSYNKDLQNKNSRQESTISDLKSQVCSLEHEIKQLKESVNNYKQKYDRIHSEMKEKQSYIHHQEQKIQDLEHGLQNRDQTIVGLKTDFEGISKQKNYQEGELERTKLQLEMSEKSRKMFDSEKMRLNEVILSLQQKVKVLGDKNNSKKELIAQQGKKFEEKDKLLQQLQKEMTEMTHHLDKRNIEVKSLTDSVNNLQSKVFHLEEELKTANNVISFLNHHLTERCIYPDFKIPETLEPSPSTVAQRQLEKIQSGRKSTSPNNSPIANANVASKPVRKDTPTSNKKASHTPSRFQASGRTDSAYCTSPSSYAQQTTPESHLRNERNLSQTELEIDQSALSAAFGDGNHVLKHSTAKKQTNTVKSTIPKCSKKR